MWNSAGDVLDLLAVTKHRIPLHELVAGNKQKEIGDTSESAAKLRWK